MVTTNIREYSDDDIIVLINGVESGEIPYTMNDLKKLLAEVTNRRLDAKHTNTLTNLMQGEITGSRPATAHSNDIGSSTKRPVAERQSRERYNEPEFDDSFSDDYEKFPVLSFLSGLFKVIAWLLLIICISAGAIAGFVYLKGEIMYIAAATFGGIMIGTIFLLFFYAQSEKIQLQLEIERHLRRK